MSCFLWKEESVREELHRLEPLLCLFGAILLGSFVVLLRFLDDFWTL